MLETCVAIVENAAKAYPNLFQSIAVSAQGGFIGQPSPPDGLKCLDDAWGHTPLAWPVPHELDGRDCWCGRSGCLDCFLSLGGLETEYHNITQTRLGINAIAAAADASDLVASSFLQVLDDRIGRTTAMIINMFDPDMIIIGGRLAGLDRLYQNVPRKWPGYLLVERNETKLQRANQDAFTLAKGAACLAIDPAI